MAGPGKPFLSRWSQRKRDLGRGGGVPVTPVDTVDAADASDGFKGIDAIDLTGPTELADRGSNAAESIGIHADLDLDPGTNADVPAQLGKQGKQGDQGDQGDQADCGERSMPTLADVALLTRESDYGRFVTAGVDETVKRAALRKLFTDPHFNVMDGLDTYIDDYGKPDPLPASMLRRLNQSKFLRLFDDDGAEDSAPISPAVLAPVASKSDAATWVEPASPASPAFQASPANATDPASDTPGSAAIASESDPADPDLGVPFKALE